MQADVSYREKEIDIFSRETNDEHERRMLNALKYSHTDYSLSSHNTFKL